MEDGVFLSSFVESEKKNLIATIESERNDKRAYANSQLLKILCGDDSFGLPRLGETEQVAAITPQALYDHYQKLLRESPIEIFYVGSGEIDQVAELLMPLLNRLAREVQQLPPQTRVKKRTPTE